MQFVHHDVTQILEQLRPFRVVRQNTGVKHIRICQHDVRPLPDRPPRILRRIAVVREGAKADPR
jgi:hypothetical protein